MAAATTVSQAPLAGKSGNTIERLQPITTAPRCGVVTLFGFGVNVRIERGHLIAEDGIGPDRRHYRFPRVGHRLQRLIIIGADGLVSLAALRWLADQDAAFVMLAREGRVLCTTGPVRPSDSRLRRAQALAQQTGADMTIARELISKKLTGQERVVRDKLRDGAAAQVIADYRLALAEAEGLDAIRFLESKGAAAYWAAWRDVPIVFPRKDLRVPEHWRTFGTRKSLLSGSPRLATNPANAMLNYLYAVLESESRLAAAALGLDPGIGFIHVDAPARDSLACDIMEVVRPQVDRYVLDWINQQPVRREWFFEQRDGNCRLMADFTVRLSETAPMWARSVAPVAEWIARQLWIRQRKSSKNTPPPTRLTQRHKREAKGAPSLPQPECASTPQTLCNGCGREIERGRTHCVKCAVPLATDRLRVAAQTGREVAHTPAARAKQGETQRQHRQAEASWSPASQPEWLTAEFYASQIQPCLSGLSASAIASALAVSRWYAGRIREGYRPHPRHWRALANLTGLTARAPESQPVLPDS